MNNPYALIIQPKENRYKNTKKVSDKNLILNTSISDHRYVSKEAIVKALPGAFKTPLQESDEVMVHSEGTTMLEELKKIVVIISKKICTFVI